ncbi:MAG: 2Fe-2S iron-sulfur cluster-binding protein [Helicobacteraceae bacterium]|jgi:succinate dehydrogenase / fumarate reductase iron-sulfur subunit|nr:2Fe-2S iron-sulfur cluster-binding protein [Helicobacteraceae bacterium]
MILNIMRSGEQVSYKVSTKEATLLQLLSEIKTTQDATLSFASGCRSSVCGSCAMRVNGKEVLACAYKPQSGDLVEPLRNVPVIRDLVVDMEKALSFNKVAQSWAVSAAKLPAITPEDASVNEVQSDCILCGACYSACPVYAVNPEFIGPFALTRNWRYVSDKREEDVAGKIAAVQSNGIWDCTLCGECVPVCPQGIAPKSDIDMLRNKSNVLGYMDPKYADFGGGLDFGAPVF